MSTHDAAGTTVVDDRGVQGEQRILAPVDWKTVEHGLWLVAILAMLSDLATTYVGIEMGLTEGNPLVRLAMVEYGMAGLAVVKLPALTLALTVRLLFRQYRFVIPLGLTVPWAVAAWLNTLTLV